MLNYLFEAKSLINTIFLVQLLILITNQITANYMIPLMNLLKKVSHYIVQYKELVLSCKEFVYFIEQLKDTLIQ